MSRRPRRPTTEAEMEELVMAFLETLRGLSIDERVTVAGTAWMTVLHTTRDQVDGLGLPAEALIAHADRIATATREIAAAPTAEARGALASLYSGVAEEGRPS